MLKLQLNAVRLLASLVALAIVARATRLPLTLNTRTPIARAAHVVDSRPRPWRRLFPNRPTQEPRQATQSALPDNADRRDEGLLPEGLGDDVLDTVPTLPANCGEINPATDEKFFGVFEPFSRVEVQIDLEVANFVPEIIPGVDPEIEKKRQSVLDRRGNDQNTYKSSVPFLSQQQREIAYGMALGDGNLLPIGWNARLAIEQSSGQAVFVNDLFNVFKTYTFAAAPQFHGRVRKGAYDPAASVGFNTFTHPVFTQIYEMFYRSDGVTRGGNPRRVKHIPEDVDSWLTPRVLAYHIMCDGGNTNDQALNLNTHGFTKEDVERYRDALKRLFGITTTIQRRFVGTKIYHFIYVPKRHMARLKEVVLPYMRPYFLYKLSINHPENIGRVRAHKR